MSCGSARENDMSSLRGPDGSPSDPDELGSLGSAPAAADAPIKKPIPRPAEGSARGPLAMEPDELAAFIRESGITFPVLTPEEKAEAEAQARVREEITKLHKAI